MAALWAAPLHAQVVNLTPNQVLAVASEALRSDQPEDAGRLADALLERFPDNPQALLLRTEAAILSGDFPGAVRFGQRAFWNAANGIQRFNASRLIALGHARQMQDSRAQLWLRAARQFAPSDAASESVARDFQALRQRNPLSVSLRFGISPSDNLNNGTTLETIGIGSLPLILSEDAQPIAGVEFNGRLNLRYRAHANRTSATFLDFGVSGRTFRFNDSDRQRLEDDPGSDIKEGSDLSSAQINVGATHRFVFAPDIGVSEAGLSFTRTLQKDDDERTFATVFGSHDFTLSDADRLSFSTFMQRSREIESGDETQLTGLSATYTRVQEGLGTFSFGLGLRNSLSDIAREDYDSVTYRFGYATAEPLFGVNLGLNASFEQRDYIDDPLFNAARNDDITRIGVRASFSDVELFGFQPVVTVDYTDTNSPIVFYDRDFTTFGFDIVSSF